MNTIRYELNKNLEAFFALVRAGLWEQEVRLSSLEIIDFAEVYRLAGAQSVIGLVAAGIDYVADVRPSKEDVLQFVGQTLQIEQRNISMNSFIEGIVKKMQEKSIYALLVKGQGIAQCYERPLWRTSGDIDFLMSSDNYEKAKQFMLPLCSTHKSEERYSGHLGLSIDPWYVEIHGSLRTGLSERVDREVDAVQQDVFCEGKVRSWQNGKTTVFIPAPDNDVFFVFTHFIKHLYKEGLTLRQVCDWCRLLWKYKESLNQELLESRINKAGLMREWRVFASLSVNYLGMPVEAMPLYDERFKRKSSKLMNFILNGYSGNKVKDTWRVGRIFPWKTFCYLPSIFLNVNRLKIKERIQGR